MATKTKKSKIQSMAKKHNVPAYYIFNMSGGWSYTDHETEIAYEVDEMSNKIEDDCDGNIIAVYKICKMFVAKPKTTVEIK